MRRIVLSVVVLFCAVGLAGASSSGMRVPGDRVVVIHPGDVVVQAGDLPHIGTYMIEGSANGEVTIEQVLFTEDGEMVVAPKENVDGYLRIQQSGSTCYRAFSYTDSSTYSFTTPCDGTTGHGTTRYIEVTGTWEKYGSDCNWVLADPPTVRIEAANSNNASLTNFWALDLDDCGGSDCYRGQTTNIHFSLQLTLSSEGRFRIFVDFYGWFGQQGCPQ